MDQFRGTTILAVRRDAKVVIGGDGQVTLGNVVMKIRGRPETQVTLDVRRGKQKLVIILRRRAMQKSGGQYRRKG